MLGMIVILIRMLTLGPIYKIIEIGAISRLKKMILDKYDMKVDTRTFGANYVGAENLHVSVITPTYNDKKILDQDRDALRQYLYKAMVDWHYPNKAIPKISFGIDSQEDIDAVGGKHNYYQ